MVIPEEAVRRLTAAGLFVEHEEHIGIIHVRRKPNSMPMRIFARKGFYSEAAVDRVINRFRKEEK